MIETPDGFKPRLIRIDQGKRTPVDVDGWAREAFHIRAERVRRRLIFVIAHIPTGLKFPYVFGQMGDAVAVVRDALDLPFDWWHIGLSDVGAVRDALKMTILAHGGIAASDILDGHPSEAEQTAGRCEAFARGPLNAVPQ